jgi:hypothetical protein
VKEPDKETARAAWRAALRWYQNQTDDFSQDRLRAADQEFERWWRIQTS